MRSRWLVFAKLIILLVVLVGPGFVCAQESPLLPGQIMITTPVYKPDPSLFEPQLGTYTYEISWQGIPAAVAQIDINSDGIHYKFGARARTYSAIDIFYKLRYQADGLVSAFDYSPIESHVQQQENSKKKDVQMKFLEDGTIQTIRVSGTNEPEEYSFNSGSFTLDPFSSALLARGLDWHKDDVKYFDTFNGKSRYLISLTATDLIRMRVNGVEKDVWVISPRVVNLTSAKQTKKLREAKVYVTADRNRDILQISSSVFIGSVKTKLVSFAPAPSTTKLAKNEPEEIFFE